MKKLQTPIKGIDVSKWQGKIDWKSVKEDNINFAIIKCGGSDASSPYTDPRFYENYQEAKKHMLVGTYYFAGDDLLVKGGNILAEHCLSIIKACYFQYPVYLDIERNIFIGRQEQVTKEAINFCETIKNYGYTPGIYASDISGFYNSLILDRIKQYSIWVARYGSVPKYVSEYDIWQNSGNGIVKGITGAVDTNFCYYDICKSVQEIPDTLIDEIWDGEWGNGEERKQKLEQAGYDYVSVQSIINERLR